MTTGDGGVPHKQGFAGDVWCHAPADAPVDLARLADAGDGGDRWSHAGQPTVYLAADPGVALAELGRHLPPDAPDGSARRLLHLRLSTVHLADLRDAATRAAVLGREAPLDVFLDRDVATQAADAVRADPRFQGLLVPSVAFLDAPERAVLVLFPERIEGGHEAVIEACREDGEVALTRQGGTTRDDGRSGAEGASRGDSRPRIDR